MAAELPDVWNGYYIGTARIGEGIHGTIYKAIDEERARNMVTIKKVKMNLTVENGVPSAVLREITLLKLLQHPNIVSLEDVIMGDDQLYLVFEFVSMNLKCYIGKIPDDKWMDKAEQKSYLYQILQGIYYCHQRNILHRNLKPQNLLVDEKGRLKLADFCFDETVNSLGRHHTQEVYIRFYKAPELLFGLINCTSAIDIWSIGCITAEMAVKQALFPPGDSNIDQIFRIFKVLSTPCEEVLHELTNIPNCSETFPKWTNNHLHEILNRSMDADGIEIVQKMLNYKPSGRISAKELLEDPYFADVDRTKLPISEY
ncbi:Protein kinase domain family protein [Acanthocheilonema viteae]